jgi:hypothetical protein
MRAARTSALLILVGATVSCSREQPAPEANLTSSASPGSTASATKAARPRSRRTPPSLDVPQIDGADLRFDGVLDEAAWSRAATTGAFVHAGDGSDAAGLPIGGRARLFWDEAHLYVAFEVRDANVRGGFSQGAVDPHLWERDTVELMIDPDGDGDGRDYYEVQIGPQGLVFDARFDDYNRPRGGPNGPFGHQDWSSKVERGVKLLGTLDDDADVDEGYVVEARIPWASFDKAEHSPPRVGETWRINLYAMQDNGGVAWSPILGEGNFHRASRFGRVRFAGGRAEAR